MEIKSNVQKCLICKRKIKKCFMDITCKCGEIFCNEHLPSFKHECKFDYRKEKTKYLSTTLVKVESEKIVII